MFVGWVHSMSLRTDKGRVQRVGRCKECRTARRRRRGGRTPAAGAAAPRPSPQAAPSTIRIIKQTERKLYTEEGKGGIVFILWHMISMSLTPPFFFLLLFSPKHSHDEPEAIKNKVRWYAGVPAHRGGACGARSPSCLRGAGGRGGGRRRARRRGRPRLRSRPRERAQAPAKSPAARAE